MMEKKREKKKEEIIDIPKKQGIIVEIVAREVRDVTSTPFWAWMLLIFYIFFTPFFAWFFGWSWWPSFGVYVIIAVMFGVVLTLWGRQRRRQASKLT